MTDERRAGEAIEQRWEKHGNASLLVRILNGNALVVDGSGLTTEEAVEAVCSYLPVVPAAGGSESPLVTDEAFVLREQLAESESLLAAEREGRQEVEEREWKRVQDAYSRNAREREELRQVQARLSELQAALENLVSYAENLPPRDADLWHGWDDFQANIRVARSCLVERHNARVDQRSGE